MLKRVLFVLFAGILGGCSLSEDEPPAGFYIVSYTANFSQSRDNWEVDFADYAVADSAKYALTTGVADLPPSTGYGASSGLLVSGKNNGDNLFMFLKRKVGGLSPNTDYTIVFDVQLASNAPSNLINGNVTASPGAGVYLKVGALDINPMKEVKGDYYRMNIDKGAQNASGKDMVLIGDIGTSDGNQNYSVITRSNSSVNTPIIAHTNGEGELWLIVGTDSRYVGTTSIYYSRIDVVFSANQ